jgi:uncharacterized protein YjiS (DUF1127 family)
MKANHLQPRGDRLADSRRPTPLDALSDAAQSVAGVLRLWRCRRRDRRQLAKFMRIDDRMLADVGLTRCGAEFLIDKPFWRE